MFHLYRRISCNSIWYTISLEFSFKERDSNVVEKQVFYWNTTTKAWQHGAEHCWFLEEDKNKVLGEVYLLNSPGIKEEF